MEQGAAHPVWSLSGADFVTSEFDGQDEQEFNEWRAENIKAEFRRLEDSRDTWVSRHQEADAEAERLLERAEKAERRTKHYARLLAEVATRSCYGFDEVASGIVSFKWLARRRMKRARKRLVKQAEEGLMRADA